MSRGPVGIVFTGLLILTAGHGFSVEAAARRQAAAAQRPGGGEQAFVGTSIPYSVGRALPDKAAGWTRTPQIHMYRPGDLWEYINGAAEQYLAYEFQDLATATYTLAAGGSASVEIYRMIDALHAYGIYAQELSPTASRVAIGVEGRAGRNSLKFWSNEFYVKVVSPSGSAPPQADVLALASAVAAGLGAPGKPPAQLAWFPRSSLVGLLADSITFVPADALGQSMFANAFEAKYAGTPEPSTLVIVPFATVDGARGALAKYESFLGGAAKGAKQLLKPADGGFAAEDGYYGRIVAVRSGSMLVISLGAASEAAATMLITDAISRLPAAPARSKSKGGAQ
jgi:hypothetical protein